MRYLTITCLLFLLVGGPGRSGGYGAPGATPVVELRVPPLPQDLDLRSVERLYWGGAWGRLMLFHNIYAHTPPVENLLLENIDVIGKEGTPHFIHLEGWGTPARRVTKPMRNVSFRNIVFEERRRPGNSSSNSYQKARLIDFDTATVAGTIENLVFDNISLDRKLAEEGALLGTALSPIKGVTLRGITAGGEPILRRERLPIRINEHVSGIRFE